MTIAVSKRYAESKIKKHWSKMILFLTVIL